MKAAAVLVLVSALLGLAAANEIDKQQLCTEVCWTYDVNNHTDCQKRCVEGNRPTADEAGQCQACIDDCAAYLSESMNVPLYAECRGGCFAKYFPMFVGGRKAVKTAHKQKEHIPGLPARIHFRLGGTNYPVEDRICEISCRAKGVDNILANGSDAMDICLKGCKKAPSTREQELQMSLDCNKECASNGKVAEGCLEPCIVQQNPNFPIALSNATAATNASNSSGSPMPAGLNSTVVTPIAPAVPVADVPQKASSTPTTAKPKPQSTNAAEAVGAEGSTAVSESEVPSGASASATESASSNSDRKKADRVSGAGGQPYFESASFWFHAAGTLTIAMIIGFQLV